MIFGLIILYKISHLQNLIEFEQWKLLCFQGALIPIFTGDCSVMGLHICQYSVAKEVLLTMCWDLLAFHFQLVLVK